MLLESNTKKVIDLIHQFDNLSDIDKLRLAIYLLENKNFKMKNKISTSMLIVLFLLIIVGFIYVNFIK